MINTLLDEYVFIVFYEQLDSAYYIHLQNYVTIFAHYLTDCVISVVSVETGLSLIRYTSNEIICEMKTFNDPSYQFSQS